MLQAPVNPWSDTSTKEFILVFPEKGVAGQQKVSWLKPAWAKSVPCSESSPCSCSSRSVALSPTRNPPESGLSRTACPSVCLPGSVCCRCLLKAVHQPDADTTGAASSDGQDSFCIFAGTYRRRDSGKRIPHPGGDGPANIGGPSESARESVPGNAIGWRITISGPFSACLSWCCCRRALHSRICRNRRRDGDSPSALSVC